MAEESEPIRVPPVGETSQPVVVAEWLVSAGGQVHSSDRVVELLVGGVLVYVSAPCGGVIGEVSRVRGDRVTPGEILGWVRCEDEPDIWP